MREVEFRLDIMDMKVLGSELLYFSHVLRYWNR